MQIVVPHAQEKSKKLLLPIYKSTRNPAVIEYIDIKLYLANL